MGPPKLLTFETSHLVCLHSNGLLAQWVLVTSATRASAMIAASSSESGGGIAGLGGELSPVSSLLGLVSFSGIIRSSLFGVDSVRLKWNFVLLAERRDRGARIC